MGYTIADCIIIPLVLFGLYKLVSWFGRTAVQGTREVKDCVRVYRRGVLTVAQVREEFIATTGREPTIQEAHDLQEMIATEHNQARNALIDVGAAIAAVLVLTHSTAKGRQ